VLPCETDQSVFNFTASVCANGIFGSFFMVEEIYTVQ
jgi:hypothetical protein